MLKKGLGLRRIIKSEFLKNAAILVTGTASAQLITLFTAPVLTRIYSPEHYGLLGIYIMFTTLIGTLATLQYNNIILTTKEEKEAEQAVVLCIYLSLAFAILTLIAVFFLGPLISLWFNTNAIGNWLLLAPVSVFFTGWGTTFTYFANRHKQYKLLSANRIIAAVLVPVISISVGFLVSGPMGLFAGLLIGQVVSAVMLSNFFLFRNKTRLEFSFNKVRHLVKKYRSFAVYSMPSEFINNFINQLPIMLLGRYYNATVIGHYNLSGRILGMPIQLVSSAIGEVFRQKAAHEYNTNGNCQSVFRRTFITSSLLSLFPFLILFLFGPWLFTFFFGEKWTEAGIFSQILAPLFLLRFVVSPLSYMFIIAGKQREDMWVHISVVFLIVATFVISKTLTSDYYITLICYSAVYSLTYFYYLYRSYQFSKGIKPNIAAV